MSQARLSVRKFGETLRLKFEAGVSDRQIAAELGRCRAVGAAVLAYSSCAHRAVTGICRGPSRAGLDEYNTAHVDVMQNTAFCKHYRHWLATEEVVFRQVHVPGDRLFVNDGGQSMLVVDRLTGEVSVAQLFVAMLGCSNYTYAKATWSQALPDWFGIHGRASAGHHAPSCRIILRALSPAPLATSPT